MNRLRPLGVGLVVVLVALLAAAGPAAASVSATPTATESKVVVPSLPVVVPTLPTLTSSPTSSTSTSSTATSTATSTVGTSASTTASSTTEPPAVVNARICAALTVDGVALVRDTDVVARLVVKLFGQAEPARPSAAQVGSARNAFGCGSEPDQSTAETRRAVCAALTQSNVLAVLAELPTPTGLAATVLPIARFGLGTTVGQVRDELGCGSGGRSGGGRDGDDGDDGSDGRDGDDGDDGSDGRSGSRSSGGSDSNSDGVDDSYATVPSGAPDTGGA